jgi:hypothetical protein
MGARSNLRTPGPLGDPWIENKCRYLRERKRYKATHKPFWGPHRRLRLKCAMTASSNGTHGPQSFHQSERSEHILSPLP